MEKLKHAFHQQNKFQLALLNESLEILLFNHLKVKKVFLKQLLEILIKVSGNFLAEP